MTRRLFAAVLAAAYVGTIVAANWAIAAIGVITVWPWPHLVAPAAVLFVGLAFTLRDLLHDAAGWVWTLAAIGVGTAVSVAVAGRGLAFAAGAAFALSELADLAVYAPLRRRGRWLSAVALSNTIGLVVDSLLFLWLAFGSLTFLPGQIVGKAVMTLLAVAVLSASRAVARARRIGRAVA